MSRYISKLPEPIRALAYKRIKEQEDAKELYDAFIWDETPEGHLFWRKINDEDYSAFYNLYPQRDKLDELIEFIEKESNAIPAKMSEREKGEFAAYETILTKAKEIKNK